MKRIIHIRSAGREIGVRQADLRGEEDGHSVGAGVPGADPREVDMSFYVGSEDNTGPLISHHLQRLV